MSERLTLERLEQIQWAFAELLTEARRSREVEARLESENDTLKQWVWGGAVLAQACREDALRITHNAMSGMDEKESELVRAREAEARLERERDEAIADNAAIVAACEAYFKYHGGEHEDDGCPEDDTCRCPRLTALNKALSARHAGTALLEEHRKALVRARNDGLEKAAQAIEGMAREADRDRDDASGGTEEAEADGAGAALWTARNRIRALKEPES